MSKDDKDDNNALNSLSSLLTLCSILCNRNSDNINSSISEDDNFTTELHRITRRSITDDELLFCEPPPKEDCPICFLPMPHSGTGIGGVHAIFQSCCGTTVCSGCMAAVHKGKAKKYCPFCRVETANTSEEHIKRTKLRMQAGVLVHFIC